MARTIVFQLVVDFFAFREGEEKSLFFHLEKFFSKIRMKTKKTKKNRGLDRIVGLGRTVQPNNQGTKRYFSIEEFTKITPGTQ